MKFQAGSPLFRRLRVISATIFASSMTFWLKPIRARASPRPGTNLCCGSRGHPASTINVFSRKRAPKRSPTIVESSTLNCHSWRPTCKGGLFRSLNSRLISEQITSSAFHSHCLPRSRSSSFAAFSARYSAARSFSSGLLIKDREWEAGSGEWGVASLYPLPTPHSLNFMPVGERFVHRHFVGVFEIAADWQPHGDPRDAEAERFEQTGQVIGRSLALRVRVCGEDDFFDAAFAALVRAQAFEQVFDPKLFRPNASNRRERPVQDVVHPVVFARLFNRHQVVWLLDDADDGFVSRMAGTETARIDVRQVVAGRTEDDLLFDLADGFDQAIGFFLRGFEHMKRQSLRRFVTDARQAFEFIYELRYGFCVIKHIRLRIADCGLRNFHCIQ